MNEKTLARRYAAALLGAAEKEGSIGPLRTDLLALKDVFLKDGKLRAALLHPKVPRAAKKRFLRKPFEGGSSRAFVEFLDLVIRKNRVEILPDVADMFDRLADVSQGIVRVQVRSYLPLTDAQRESLDGKLRRITGKQVKMEVDTDASLRGGMSVRIGDTVLDDSVAHRLKELSEDLVSVHMRR